MQSKLSLIRTAFLNLIMARYGPWYLLCSPSGRWYAAWHYDVDDERAMESYLIEDDVDERYGFATRRTALKYILESLDEEIQAGAGERYIEARQRARDSLISITTDQDPEVTRNDFSGTSDEAQLIEDWIESDRRKVHANAVAAEKRADHLAACAEQERREKVFEHIVKAFGDRVIEDLNAVIERAWQTEAPKSRRTAHGEKVGDVIPRPQLVIMSGRVSFISPARAKPMHVKTPLSKRDTIRGYVHHWVHPTWTDIVVPAMAKIINGLERDIHTSLPLEGAKDGIS